MSYTCVNRDGCHKTGGCGIGGCKDAKLSDSYTTRFIEAPNYFNPLSICDDEVKAMFEGKAYEQSLPIQVQLIKELRLLREAILHVTEDE